MKSFIATVCLFVTLSNAEYVVKTREDLIQYRQECVKELSVPAAHVEQFQRWEYPNDATTQCYLKCVFGKFGLFDTQTGFNIELIHEQLAGGAAHVDHNDELHGKIAGCIDKNEQGSNACEWAYRGASCLLKNHLPLVQQSLVSRVSTAE